MATAEVLAEKEKVQGINADYTEKFGFSDPETGYAYKAPKGLTREIVEQISEYKNEPQWMRDFRLKSLEIFESKPTPQWGADLDQITAAVLASLERYGLDEPALRLARGIVRSNAESVRRGADPGDVVADTLTSLRAVGWVP